jgi:THO complex subunit 2
MSSSDVPKGGKGDSGSGHDQSPVAQSGTSALSSGQSQQDSGPRSLRSRIGGEAAWAVPQAPPNSFRPELSRPDEERDSGKKRTISGEDDRHFSNYVCVYEIVDREKDINESVTSIIEQASQPPKRPRINRNRYPSSQSHALAKKLLPIDPQAGDKSRSGRKD